MAGAVDDDALAARRADMVRAIAGDAMATADATGRKAFSERVMQAMGGVPRHAFVGPGQQGDAYRNVPLPIGQGQTISQPYVVALMTDVLDLAPSDRVLEVGSGCGYQSAVLARLAAHVYAVEIAPKLADAAAARLKALGVTNVTARTGDGAEGWPEYAPFDAILVAAAPREIPPALIAQLKPGGRLVCPVGKHTLAQDLLLVTKDAKGGVSTRRILPVAFVPLTRGA